MVLRIRSALIAVAAVVATAFIFTRGNETGAGNDAEPEEHQSADRRSQDANVGGNIDKPSRKEGSSPIRGSRESDLSEREPEADWNLPTQASISEAAAHAASMNMLAPPVETAKSTEPAVKYIDHPEFTDLTPRPFVHPGLSRTSKLPDGCSHMSQRLVDEQRDVQWAESVEAELLELWRAQASGPYDDAVFIHCRTSVCQVTYRTQTGIPVREARSQIDTFVRAFRQSPLRGQLKDRGYGAAANVMFAEFQRRGVPFGSDPEHCQAPPLGE